MYHRITPHVVLPMFRGAMGATLRTPLGGYDTQVAFTAEVHGGAVARFGRGANYGIIGEVGYTYEGFDMHLGTAGLGGIWGIEPPRDDERTWNRFRVAVVPHVVVGTAYDAFALGARPSVVVGYSVWAVELAWQVLSVREALTHEARVMFTTITPFLEAQ